MATTTDSCDVLIAKFDILAAYTYAKGLFDGLGDDEAKERGMVAAILGAKARMEPTSRGVVPPHNNPSIGVSTPISASSAAFDPSPP